MKDISCLLTAAAGGNFGRMPLFLGEPLRIYIYNKKGVGFGDLHLTEASLKRFQDQCFDCESLQRMIFGNTMR